MQDYSAAQGVLAFLEVVGWMLVVAAAVLGLLAWGEAGPLVAVALAGAGVVMGLVVVAVVQIARAQIDTALNTRAMLAELRRGPALPPGAAPRGDAPFWRPETADGEVVKLYRGTPIVRRNGAFEVGTRAFDTVLAAERFIDGRG